MRYLVGSVLSVGLIVLNLVSCGKSGEDVSSVVGAETSFYRSTLADFPSCNSARKGFLAYATDTAMFYQCDGTTWTAVSITGPTGATGSTGATGATGASGSFTVYSNGTAIGTLMWADWPNVAIGFSNSAVGLFTTSGIYANAICTGGHCSMVPVSAGHFGLYFPTKAAAGVEFPTGTQVATKSYLLFTDTACSTSGSGYSQFRPLKNSIFMISGGFVKASGSETQSSYQLYQSALIYDMGATNVFGRPCTAIVGSAYSGAYCCQIEGIYGAYYPVTSSYTYPSGVSYPFASPLTFY